MSVLVTLMPMLPEYRWFVDSEPRMYLEKRSNDVLNNLCHPNEKIRIGKSKCYVSRADASTIECCDEDGVNVILQREKIAENESKEQSKQQQQSSQSKQTQKQNNALPTSKHSHNVVSNNNNVMNNNNSNNNGNSNGNSGNSTNNTTKNSSMEMNGKQFIKNIGQTLIPNESGWNFNNDFKQWQACDSELSMKLDQIKCNVSFDYNICNWPYKITKIDCNLAEQFNTITHKRRYLCKTEYISIFENNIKIFQDCSKKMKTICKKGNGSGNPIANVSVNLNANQHSSPHSGLHPGNEESSNKFGVYPSIVDKSNNSKLIDRARLHFHQTMPTHKYRIAQITDLINNENIPASHLAMYKTALESDDNHSEIYCFHGTHTANVDFIIQNGFDRSFNKNSLYGKGVYLAKNASLSVGFCQKANDFCTYKNNLCMFYCKAIVGDCVIGQQDKTAHYKSDGKTQYTTLVDSLNNPKIYVITKDFFVIPMVLIQFQPVNGGI